MADPKICSIDGCSKKSFVRGWCSLHYHRWQRHGNPTAGQPQHGIGLQWLQAQKSFNGSGWRIWPFSRRVDGRPSYIQFRGHAVNPARVMCYLAHGEPPKEKPLAAHNCGKAHEGCIHPKHLSWASYGKNQLDRARDGTDIRGEKHPGAKLKREDILQIRRSEER